jgi:hypothetical protein
LIRVTRSNPSAAEISPWRGRLVERRQGLRTNECRGNELVLGGYLDLAGRNPQQRLAVDDEPRHAAHATRPRVSATDRSVRGDEIRAREGAV